MKSKFIFTAIFAASVIVVGCSDWGDSSYSQNTPDANKVSGQNGANGSSGKYNNTIDSSITNVIDDASSNTNTRDATIESETDASILDSSASIDAAIFDSSVVKDAAACVIKSCAEQGFNCGSNAQCGKAQNCGSCNERDNLFCSNYSGGICKSYQQLCPAALPVEFGGLCKIQNRALNVDCTFTVSSEGRSFHFYDNYRVPPFLIEKNQCENGGNYSCNGNNISIPGNIWSNNDSHVGAISGCSTYQYSASGCHESRVIVWYYPPYTIEKATNECKNYLNSALLVP